MYTFYCCLLSDGDPGSSGGGFWLVNAKGGRAETRNGLTAEVSRKGAGGRYLGRDDSTMNVSNCIRSKIRR